MPTSAAETEDTYNHDHIEIIFEDENLSEEFKAKATAYFLNGGSEVDDEAATYGLTCTLFGHKLKTTTAYIYRHKVRATSPRCAREGYAYDTCERCDYENSVLLSTVYISCCA
jgi:hypothetical protein